MPGDKEHRLGRAAVWLILSDKHMFTFIIIYDALNTGNLNMAVGLDDPIQWVEICPVLKAKQNSEIMLLSY